MLPRGTEVLAEEEVAHWRDIFTLSEKPTAKEFASAAKSAGDSVMYRIWTHVSDAPGNLTE